LPITIQDNPDFREIDKDPDTTYDSEEELEGYLLDMSNQSPTMEIQQEAMMETFPQKKEQFFTNMCDTIQKRFDIRHIWGDILHSFNNNFQLENMCKTDGRDKSIINKLEIEWHLLRQNNGRDKELFAQELTKFLEKNREDDQSLALALLLAPETIATEAHTFMGTETASPLEIKLTIIGLLRSEKRNTEETITRLSWANHHMSYLRFKGFIDTWLIKLFQGSDEGKNDPTLEYMYEENITTPTIHMNWMELNPVIQMEEQPYDHTSIELNILEFEDLRNMNIGNDIISMDHKASMTQLANHCMSQLLAKEDLNRTIRGLEREAHHAPEASQDQIQMDIEDSVQRLNQVNADYVTNCTKLESLLRNGARFQDNLEVPEYGMNDNVEFEDLRLVVPIFNYEMENNVELLPFWKKIKSLGLQRGWSENSYKTVLNG
jgi:hypothetical protein